MPKSRGHSLEAVASRLRNLARSGAQVWFRKHAEEELRKDAIAKVDVVEMLKACRVTLVESRNGEETLRAEGKDHEGRDIAAVVVCYDDRNEIKVITGWASEKR